MKIPYFKILDEPEKEVYESVIAGVTFKKIECWYTIPPEGFISESERDGFTK